MNAYQSTKSYGFELGMSCAFRQWRARSHCRHLHGYSLAFRFVFEADTLDEKNWVVDFGNMKSLKQRLEMLFDHTTVIAADDPELAYFKEGQAKGVLDLIVLDDTGCEKFAEHVFMMAQEWLASNGYTPRCRVASVEVKEHGANSAIIINKESN
jgi:6-pyruvoyltetrahydropterin/6-carboxytetrahydropterin synthase